MLLLIKMSFIDHASGIQLPEGCKLEIEKKTVMSQFANMTSSSTLFDIVVFLLSSLVTVPGFVPMPWLILELAIFIYKGLDRHTEIRNSPVWVLLHIWRLEQVRDTKFGWNVSHKKCCEMSRLQLLLFLNC